MSMQRPMNSTVTSSKAVSTLCSANGLHGAMPRRAKSGRADVMTFLAALCVMGHTILHAPTALAAEPANTFMVHTVDGRRHEVPGDELVFSAEAPAIRNADKPPLDWRDVDTIEFGNPSAAAATGRWSFTTRCGAILLGDVVGGDAKHIRIRHKVLGEVQMPLDVLDFVAAREDIPMQAQGSNEEDVVTLNNGDIARGVVSQVSGAGLILFDGDADRELTWSEIRMVWLAGTPASPPARLPALVYLADGTRISAEDFRLSGGQLEIRKGQPQTVAGQTMSLPRSVVRRIEIIGGRRTWLSMLPPSTYEPVPYMDIRWPYRCDLNVVGGPLQLRGKSYARGLGLHSACKITWDLAGRFDRLRYTIGIDDSAGSWADADVRILLDGRELLAHEHLRRADAPRDADLSIAGGRQLVIEIGFGAGGDTQDRVNLVNAALIAK